MSERKIPCEVCGGEGRISPRSYDGDDGSCDCCGGLGLVYLADVADEFLYKFRGNAGMAAEMVRRGYDVWVRDCAGYVVPMTVAEAVQGEFAILGWSALAKSKTTDSGAFKAA